MQHFGELRAIMHEGQTGPVIAVERALARPHAFAVGALAELRGEVTIVDGALWLAIGDRAAGAARVTRPASTSEQATLLVVAHVARWRRAPIDRPVAHAELDAFLEHTARSLGVDVARPFPVRIEGRATVDWHVLGGPPPHAGPGGHADHADHRRHAITGRLDRAPVHLVGFFAQDAQGVYTHRGERSHLHVVDEAAGVMGHADSIALEPGGHVLVPAP